MLTQMESNPDVSQSQVIISLIVYGGIAECLLTVGNGHNHDELFMWRVSRCSCTAAK